MRRYQSDWIPISDVCSSFVALGGDEKAAREDIVAAWRDGELTVRCWLIEPTGAVLEELDRRRVAAWKLTVDTVVDWPASRALVPLTSGKSVLARCEAAWQSVVSLLGSLEPAPQPVQAPKRGGGRPLKWNWEDFWCELCRRVHDGGLPETQAELVKEMQQWWQDNYQDEPAKSEIQGRISQLFHRFQRT